MQASLKGGVCGSPKKHLYRGYIGGMPYGGIYGGLYTGAYIRGLYRGLIQGYIGGWYGAVAQVQVRGADTAGNKPV